MSGHMRISKVFITRRSKKKKCKYLFTSNRIANAKKSIYKQ